MESNIRLLYSHSILNISPLLQQRFNELLKMAKMLNNICIEGEKLLPGFTNIIGDSWYAFFGRHPKIQEQDMHPIKIHDTFIYKLLRNEEYIRWHELTKGDEMFSVLTAIGMAEQLKKLLENERSQTIVVPLHNHNQFSTLLQNLNDSTISTMIQRNKKKVSNTQKAIIAVGTMDGKKREEIPLLDQFELAEKLRNDKELRKIANLVGRFKKIVLKKQKMKQKQTMERNKITVGQEISRLLPAEMANYMIPNRKVDFLRRFSEQQTFIFDTNGKEKKGRGPIIICIDESSSMTSIKEQSKAFCIALLMIARNQKRDFAIIPFATKLGDVKIFLKGQATTQELIEFSNSFLGGGTNYEHPLRESLDILLKSEFKKADVLFVTDGSSYLSSSFIQQFLQAKKEKQFECTAIVLTNFYNAVDLTVVKKFSDRVIEVGELFEADEAFAL